MGRCVDLILPVDPVFKFADLVGLSARLRTPRSDDGRFVVLQSNLGLSPDEAWQALAPILGEPF